MAAPKSKLYTRTGDGGTSALFTGERRNKEDAVFEALGCLDELNVAVGEARDAVQENDATALLAPILTEVQCNLIEAGSVVATPPQKEPSAAEPAFSFSFDNDGAKLKELEGLIDGMDARLPPLENFILPSGGLASCKMHLARVLCRRAERAVSRLEHEYHYTGSVLRYLNRLSDYFFAAARACALWTDHEEVIYQKHRPVVRPPARGQHRGSSSTTLIAAAAVVALLGVGYLVRSSRMR